MVGLMTPRLLVFIFALCCVSDFAHARRPGLESLLGFGARSRPIGAAAYGEVGYDHPLWGSWKDSESPWYGYVSPRLRAATAIWINEVDLALVVKPVSFLGLQAGRALEHRSRDQSLIVDCAALMCDGSLRADYFGTDLVLGAGGYFYAGDFHWRDFRPSDDREDFYENVSALRGRRGYDRQFSQTHTVGMKMVAFDISEWIVGLTFKRIEFHRSGDASERWSLVSSYVHEGLRFSYAAGMYRSSVLETPGVAVGVSVEWIPWKGLALE